MRTPTVLLRGGVSMPGTRGGARVDVLAALAAAALVAVAVTVGAVLRARDIRIHAEAAPLFGTWMPHTGPGTGAAIVVALLIVARGPELADRMRWRPLLGLAYLGSLAWTLSLALVDGWDRGVTGRLTTSTEYLAEVPNITDVSTFLDTFSDHIAGFGPQWTTHVAGHPPLATLVFVGLDKVGLSGGTPAALLCMVVGSSGCVAVAVAIGALGHDTAARTGLPFLVLFPGAIWVGASADGFFMAVLAWGVALFAIGATGHGPRATLVAGAGGVLLGAALFLSYGLVLAVVFPLAVYASTRRLRPLLVASASVAAVAVTFAVLGFWWPDGYFEVRERYYQPGEFGLERPYSYWAWANLAALAIAAGPAAAAGLRRLMAAPSSAPRAITLLVWAAVLAVLAADLSGMSKAEVERIWLPFTIWIVASCSLLPRRWTRAWLLAQAVTALAVNHLLLTVW